MKSKKNIALSREEMLKLATLPLYGEREVVRDRCLIGYCQKLWVAEFMVVNGANLIDSQTLLVPRRKSPIPLHPLSSYLLRKYNHDIPVIAPKTFRKHFADIVIMAGIKRSRPVLPNSIRYSALLGPPLHLKDIQATEKGGPEKKQQTNF